MMKLNVRAFALAFGIVWGVGIFLLTWWIIAFDGSLQQTIFLSRLYRGYSITPVGSLIGLIWGFFDGLIAAAIFAWLYNRLTAGNS